MRSILSIIDAASRNFGQQWHSDLAFHPSSSFHQWKRMTKRSGIWGGWGRSFRQGFFEVQISVWPEVELNVLLAWCWVYRGGLPGILTFGVGWGGDDTVPCNCTHLGATQLMFLALAHISMLRNWCFLHLHTSRCYATDVSCTCTHLGVTQLLRNWCSLHLHTSRCYATDVSCTCTHLDATRLTCTCTHLGAMMFLHLHTSRCYATDVLCNWC